MLILRLGKFLFDEEGSQMRELPRASDAENGQLDQHPPHDTAVGGFGLVTELSLTFLDG